MAKVVKKALDILTILGALPEREVPLSEISERLEGHPATIANILKVMVKSGYVEQKRVRAGYALGPMAYQLARNGPYRKDILALAEPEIVRLARDSGETALLATLTRGRKTVLCVTEGTKDVQIRPDLFLDDDLYRTATGRLLLAYQPEDQIRLSLSCSGWPGKAWDGIENEKGLTKALDCIRAHGYEIKASDPSLVAYAVPIFEGERVVAAIGVAVPDYRRVKGFDEEILRRMKWTASLIGEALAEVRPNARETEGC